MKHIFLFLIVTFIGNFLFAQENNIIKLPAPQVEKGIPLMQALNKRQSIREFSDRDIAIQELANILWAANGFNRNGSEKRTAPSAMNMQEIELFVSKKDGLFRYDAKQHSLITIHERDIRSFTGMQPFVAVAPLNIILVADLSKIRGDDKQSKISAANIDVGYVSQNIYLYCASENMATVVRGSVDKDKLAAEMGLTDNYYIILAQTVGYPK